MKKLMLHGLIFIISVLLSSFACFENGGGEDGNNNDGDQQGYEESLPADPVYDDSNAVFVAVYGSDSNGDGSFGAPFRTVQHALDVSGQGRTIVLRAGVYLESIRIRQPNITIRSHTGEWAVLQSPINDEKRDTTVMFDIDASGGKLQRLEVIGGYYYGVKFQTKWDWGDPNDRCGASRILIEDCKIHFTGRDCIKITPGCDEITIRRCEIFDSGKRDKENAEGIDNVNGDRMVVEDCNIHDIATNGVYFKGGAIDCVVQRNYIYNCGAGGVLVGFDTSPEYFDLTVNPNYYESLNGVVRNNVIFNTYSAGIGIYASFKPRIYNNTVFNAAIGVQNALHFGISFQDWDPRAKRPPTVDPEIRNNIFVKAASGEFYVVRIRYSGELGGLSSLNGMPLMSNNLYYNIDGSRCGFYDQRPANFAQNMTLMEWKDHIKGDSNSFEADPFLEANMKLTKNSPAVDRGLKNTLVRYDIDRQERLGIYDIGADEL